MEWTISYKGKTTRFYSPREIESFDEKTEALAFAEKMKKADMYTILREHSYPDMVYYTCEYYPNCKETGTEFICTLSPDKQKAILDALIKLKEELWEVNIEIAMSGRLCDLEENINWRELLSTMIKEIA